MAASPNRRPLPSAPQKEWDAYWATVMPSQPKEPVAAKATYASSPGAYALDAYPSIFSFNRNQNRLMNEALGLFHSNPWVAVAERTISSRFARVDWHLEDDEGNTIGDDEDSDASPEELAVQKLMELPKADKPRMTRRQLWNITSRHMGLAGNAFWYLDQRTVGNGAPLSVLYINPVRMTPRFDGNGNLLGWVMDGPDNPVSGNQNRPGVPIELNEVIHFTLDEPDFGIWGIGIAEAAQSKVELDRLATRHESQVFASGGRLTGMVSPKPNSGIEITDEQWKKFVLEWRNVTSDQDAAKRLIIAKGPVDWVQTSSSNEQLQLKELSGQGRDDILNSWSVPLSQVGITLAGGGLGIGERSKNDEAILWQGPIESRLEPFREKVQYEFLDRFDLGIQLVIDTPEFDDSTPLFDSAQKAASVPLTNDERREVLGLDPLDPDVYGELGKQVYILNTMQSIFDPTLPGAPSPTPDIGEPLEPLLNPPPAPVVPDQPVAAPVPAKATLHKEGLLTLRKRVTPAWERKVRSAVKEHLDSQRKIISDNVRERYAAIRKKPTDRSAWWHPTRWDTSLSSKLEPLLADFARTVGRRATRQLNKPTKADWMDNVLTLVRTKSGQRITNINDTTQQRVQELLEQGVTDGLGPAELGDLIESDGIFDEARAELIARTETALVYNEAALGSYQEFGVEEVEAVDGDDDEECADRNGQIFSLDEADSIEDHPNGTLDWIPVVPDEAKATLAIVKAALERPQPDIHYHAAPVTVQPANITIPVNVPEQKAPEITVNPSPITVKADMPSKLEITKMPQRVHKAIRNKQGQVEGSIEGDA